jgi:hypothetical protein
VLRKVARRTIALDANALLDKDTIIGDLKLYWSRRYVADPNSRFEAATLIEPMDPRVFSAALK